MLSYVHDLDPVIVHVGNSFALRWYGLAYVLGFLLGYLFLKWLSRKKLWALPEEKVGDFVTFAALFGVLLGGRLGYILFYYTRIHGWGALLDDPLVIFKTWEGGMASHGGLIGLILFSLFYARKQKISWLSLMDGLALAAPIGIFFGRIANFINGELYGRVAQGLTWAVQFPIELYENPKLAYETYAKLAEQGSSIAPASPLLKNADIAQLIATNRTHPEVTSALADTLPSRHPSQIYEALAEGLVLFLILFGLRLFFPRAGYGFIAGMFCLLYAAGRIFVECYREPDSPLMGSLTMGQFLSIFMAVIGILLVSYALKHRRPPLS